MNAVLGTDLRCELVENRYFGGGITVAGLLTGSDIFAGLSNRVHGDFVVIPSESMTGEEDLFLDDWVRADLEERLGVPVRGGGFRLNEFFEAVLPGAGAGMGANPVGAGR
jgi:NifB/MoaA-like Fe-S oxidoreductase